MRAVMNQLERLENLYGRIRVFIRRLEMQREHALAVKLRYVMAEGCWNSWTELLDAVDKMLLDPTLVNQTTNEEIVREAHTIHGKILSLLKNV